MWLCILKGRRFEETYENPQWRKVKQMQPMRLCILSGKQFKEAFENTPKRVQVNQIKKRNQIKRLCTWRSILTYNCETDNWCNQATNYFSEQNCNKLMNKPNPSRMFSVSHPPFERHPRPLWPLRHLIRVMRKHDPTNKRTTTKTNTMTNTFRELSDPWNFRP